MSDQTQLHPKRHPKRENRYGNVFQTLNAWGLLLFTAVLGMLCSPNAARDNHPTPKETVPAAPTLIVYKKTAHGAEGLPSKSIAREGDIIQLQYDGKDAAYGMIVSIDGKGTITRHFPDPGAAPRLKKGRHVLGHAFRLDNAPGFETFIFITSSKPINDKEVLEKYCKTVHTLKSWIKATPGVRGTSVVLYKTAGKETAWI